SGALTRDALPVTAFDTPKGVPQADGGLRLDPIDSFQPLAPIGVYRDGSLWIAQAVLENGSDRATLRWYEIRTNGRTGTGDGSAPTIRQQGSVDPGPGLNAFYPSINVNSAGEMALGFSLSGPDIFGGAGYT